MNITWHHLIEHNSNYRPWILLLDAVYKTLFIYTFITFTVWSRSLMTFFFVCPRRISLNHTYSVQLPEWEQTTPMYTKYVKMFSGAGIRDNGKNGLVEPFITSRHKFKFYLIKYKKFNKKLTKRSVVVCHSISIFICKYILLY